MICHEKSDLLDKYQKEVRAYSEAVLKMRQYGAALPRVEFEIVWNVVVRTRELCNTAYRSLENHVAEHRC